jgi:hypothetical protein
MATTKAILQAAADRLKSQVPGVAVELYPENPGAWRLNHPKAALLVDYRGSRYGEVVDTGIVAQGRELSIGISVVARTLHDAYGALAITDAVRLALLGRRLPDCRKLRLASERFVSQEAGNWIYELMFSAESLAVEDAEGDSGPALMRIVADYGFEEEIVE